MRTTGPSEADEGYLRRLAEAVARTERDLEMLPAPVELSTQDDCEA